MSAADRMQHFDAYIDPVTHQVQQTIYLARRNAKPKDKTDLFEIISWTKPETALDDDAPEQVQDEGRSPRSRPSSRRRLTRARGAPGMQRRCARHPSFRNQRSPRMSLLNLLPHLLNGIALGCCSP